MTVLDAVDETLEAIDDILHDAIFTQEEETEFWRELQVRASTRKEEVKWRFSDD